MAAQLPSLSFLSSHTIPVSSHSWAATQGGELRKLKRWFTHPGSCQNAIASAFFPNTTEQEWKVMFPLDFLVMAFAWEKGPHLKRSQTLSLTSTDRKQLEAKPSPCHYEAWLWCLPQCGEGRTSFLRDDKTPHQQQPEAAPLLVCCNFAVRLALPLGFPPLTPSRITCLTAGNEKQEASKGNLVWETCCPGNRDGHRHSISLQIGQQLRLSIHPNLRHQALLTHFLESQDMKKVPGSTPLESIVKSSAAH